MGHIQTGQIKLLLDAADLLAHLDAQLGVQVRQRFVHQQHLRLHHQHPRQGDPLLLAARQLVRVAFLRPDQANHLQVADNLVPDLPLADIMRPQTKGHIFEHRHMREEGVVLEDEPDLPSVDGHRRHVAVGK